MRTLAVAVAVLALSSVLQAEVRLKVYRCDEKTPLTPVDPNHPGIYGDIMVGTKLVIVVSSDAGQFWWGSLKYSIDYRPIVSLTARGDAPQYPGSCLPAADEGAEILPIAEPEDWGFQFINGFVPSPGDWFILDYRAEQVGCCDLRLYDLDVDWDVPIEVLSFTHVPSCDLSQDGIVNLKDFALLASRNSPGSDSATKDQDAVSDSTSDRTLDLRDLAQLSSRWLERIAYVDPAELDQTPGL